MIAKLYQYFGVIGIASMFAWLAALALFVVYARHPRRNFRYLVALGVAIAGLLLAHANSRRINAIEVDRTEEMEAARQAQLRALAEQARATSTNVRFAEDNPVEDPAAPGVPSYRQLGKQQREAGKKQPIPAGIAGSDRKPVPVKPVRRMKEADLWQANRLDRYNLLAARLVLLLALALVVWDYLRRFNRTFESYLPLPIPGHWLDQVSPRSHRVLAPRLPEPQLKQFLESMVRRGETFLYFGPQDLWTAPGLTRLSAGRLILSRLPKVAYDGANLPVTSEFVFEAVWFRRYGVVVTNLDTARQLLRDLRPYLAIRTLTRAAAHKTVNLVWNFEPWPPPALLGELLKLCPDTSFRCVICAAPPAPGELTARFDEVRSA